VPRGEKGLLPSVQQSLLARELSSLPLQIESCKVIAYLILGRRDKAKFDSAADLQPVQEHFSQGGEENRVELMTVLLPDYDTSDRISCAVDIIPADRGRDRIKPKVPLGKLGADDNGHVLAANLDDPHDVTFAQQAYVTHFVVSVYLWLIFAHPQRRKSKELPNFL